ncbi:MAG: tetratricopeptide repeat protein [Planctomycetaceae bacterium]
MRIRRKALIALTLTAAATVGGYLWGQTDPNVVYLKGLRAVELGQWAAVLENSDELDRFPDFASHRALLRAFELKSKGQLVNALVEFSKAQSHPATREESYFQGGSICYQLKQYGDCIRLFRQVLVWNPEHLEAHKLLAASYYDIGAMGMAVDSLTNVSRLKPEDFRPHYMQGTIYFEAERFADAHEAFEIAASLAPLNSTVADEVRAKWGECLIRLRRYEDALHAMEPARPWPAILTHRAQACFSLRQFAEAKGFAEEALTRNPLNPEAAIVVAQIHEREGHPESGVSLLQKCLAVHPMNLTLHQKLGELLAGIGRINESLAHRTRAGEIADLRQQFSLAHQNAATDASNPDLRLKLADLAEKLGETELAHGWYLAAIGMSPNDEQIQEQWKQFQARNPQTASQTIPPPKAKQTNLPKSSSPPQKSPSVEF